MENLKIKDNEFRIRKMNAIEMMALKTQISFDNLDDAIKFYNTLLENVEVLIEDKWIPVKEKGRNVFYPNEIENDGKTLEKIFEYFLKYVKEVF